MLDKSKIKASFSRKAALYDKAAELQRKVGCKLIDGISIKKSVNILDIGMGTGFLAKKLACQFKDIQIFGGDIAHGMNKYVVENTARQFNCIYPVTMDAEFLCYKDKSVDLVISNLAYQWIDNLQRALLEIKRVLKPAGKFGLSIFTENTLYELRDCFTKAYKEYKQDKPVYTHDFVKKDAIIDILQTAGLTPDKVDLYPYIIEYKGIQNLLRALKQIGALNASIDRPLGMFSPKIFRRLDALYKQEYAQNGRILATYEVLFVYGRK